MHKRASTPGLNLGLIVQVSFASSLDFMVNVFLAAVALTILPPCVREHILDMLHVCLFLVCFGEVPHRRAADFPITTAPVKQ
jgi:hypothetical protein